MTVVFSWEMVLLVLGGRVLLVGAGFWSSLEIREGGASPYVWMCCSAERREGISSASAQSQSWTPVGVSGILCAIDEWLVLVAWKTE